MAEAKRRTTRRRSQPAVIERDSFRLPEWTVDINDFGKIARGSITLAPLVLLVGRNNTGKSYAASLLWALLNAEDRAFRVRSNPSRRAPQWLRELINSACEQDDAIRKVVSKAEIASIFDYVTAFVCAEASGVFPSLFSVKEMKAPKLKIGAKETIDGSLLIKVKKSGAERASLSLAWNDSPSSLELEVTVSNGGDKGINGILAKFVADTLSSALMRGGTSTLDGDVQYIPAARTGLMLAYRPLVSTLLDTLGISNSEPQQSSLPLPTIRFLQALTEKSASSSKKVLSQIARDLEHGILGGKIAASRAQIPDFTYQPANHDAALPLHIASSMITELAPFLLLLKSGQGSQGIIFEEPEAHLHIEAQRKMALAIARLVNAGVRVILTTHSDTFVQQINNLMQLYDHPNRAALLKKFNYSDADTINPASARAYEFVQTSSGTEIVETSKVPEGFIVPTLNETLASLATETYAVQSEDY